jgi:hypothetical protein
MVRLREHHHFKAEGLCAKVLQHPEHDGQIDLPDWECFHPRDDPWNGTVDGHSLDRGMPMSSSVDA